MSTLEDLIGQWASRAQVADWQRESRKHKNRCVYVIESQGSYKIGRTENLSKRMKSLQVGNPYPMKLVHVIFTEEHVKVEQALHRIFKRDRIGNEWFSLSMRDLAVLRSISVTMIFQWVDGIKRAEPGPQPDVSKDQTTFDW